MSSLPDELPTPTKKPLTIREIRKALGTKSQQYIQFVEEKLLLHKEAPFKSGALISVLNCVIVLVATLPALALKILEFPFYLLLDQ